MLEPNDANWLRPIPLFPLPNCVLFPGAVLPLHVFEPRYIEMMQDVAALDSPDRLIAMALLREGWEPHYHTRRAPIHDMVCVGRVVQYEELADDKFNLLLLGLNRGTIVEETGGQLYRQARLAPKFDGMIGSGEQRLRDRLYRLVIEFSRCTRTLSQETVDGIFSTAPGTSVLVDVLIYHLVPAAPAIIKQAFLEETDLIARAEKLVAHLQDVSRRREAGNSKPWPPPPKLN